jgi:hypothetical protein
VDFRQFKWADIERVQLSNPIPTCGIYDDRQLNYWGQQVPSDKFGCSKLVHLSAALLAMTQLLPINSKAQAKSTSTVVTIKQITQAKTPIRAPTKRIVRGTVVRQLNDSTKLPVKDAHIIIRLKDMTFEKYTDSFGRFAIDITSKYSSFPTDFAINISHPEYLVRNITLNKNNLKPINVVFQDISIERAKVGVEEYVGMSVSSYYAEPPRSETAKPDTVVTKVKKWWQRKQKKEPH